MKGFRERAVVVVGGTSGIGAAIATEFAADGAEVVAVGLATSEPKPAGVQRVVELDVRNGLACEEFFAGIGRLDVLINCAGVIRREAEYDLDVFVDVLNVNVVGTMRYSMLARPLLARARGSIVNIASMTSFRASPRAPAYGASKAAIAQLTKSLAVEFAEDGVRVNAVAPGWIETELTRELVENPERSQEIVSRTAARRWGKPEDVVGAVRFLASPEAAFITGSVLPVDGGYLAS